jgi:hypothetical protein
MNKIVEMPKNPCFVCKKREATQLCDFVVDYVWTTMKDERGRMIGNTHITCDMPLCKECSYKVAGFDFCPYHKKMLNDLKPKDRIQWLRLE